MNQAEAMDRMYRLTRHIYDFTRKYYLFGRDALLRQMPIKPGEHILEVGCGTARNLIRLAAQYPAAHFYGLDASQQMLATAEKKIKAANVSSHIHLQAGLAEELNHQKMFGLAAPFDFLFFSYSLSIIPTWKESLTTALSNLKPGGILYIVDFWDQRNFPLWFQRLLKSWLRLFHVQYRPEFLEELARFQKEGLGTFTVKPVFNRYAFIASFQKL